MPKILFVILSLAASVNCWSADATCKIQIENVVTGTTYTIEHSFVSDVGVAADRKNFNLPGSEYECTLAYFDRNTGTMLSCQLDELGHHFVQSDRSSLDEKEAKNYLSFRYKSSFVILRSSCK